MRQANYNPDVLSCLANLSNDEVFTPPAIVNQMLDLLPDDLWHNPNATFLDPACKSGIFLREIAKRLMTGLAEEIPDEQGRANHIFTQQLYGIAITELTSLLSRRSVYCSKRANGKYSICTEFDDTQGNIRYTRMQHTWEKGRCKFCGASQEVYDREDELETHAYQFIHTNNLEKIFNMRFDVIIGNPPYQLSDGGNGASAKPIYHLFVEQAKKLSPRYLVMIIPARWFAGGKGVDAFRAAMIRDKHIRAIDDFLNASDCFGNGVEIKGGVCYFLWDKDNEGPCKVTTHLSGGKISFAERYMQIGDNDVFIRRNEAISILDKVSSFNESSIVDIISSRKPFGLPTNIVGYSNKEFGNIVLYRRNGTAFINQKEILRNTDWINKYKVYITKAYNAGDDYPHQILNKPILGMPGTCCSETYILIGPFDDFKTAKNVISYIQTRFFRFLVSLRKISQDATQKVYKFVPLQDFSEPWTDEKLYKKYNLTAEEIAFIESMIRPMD